MPAVGPVAHRRAALPERGARGPGTEVLRAEVEEEVDGRRLAERERRQLGPGDAGRPAQYPRERSFPGSASADKVKFTGLTQHSQVDPAV
jgi:hypothetical protein